MGVQRHENRQAVHKYGWSGGKKSMPRGTVSRDECDIGIFGGTGDRELNAPVASEHGDRNRAADIDRDSTYPAIRAILRDCRTFLGRAAHDAITVYAVKHVSSRRRMRRRQADQHRCEQTARQLYAGSVAGSVLKWSGTDMAGAPGRGPTGLTPIAEQPSPP